MLRSMLQCALTGPGRLSRMDSVERLLSSPPLPPPSYTHNCTNAGIATTSHVG